MTVHTLSGGRIRCVLRWRATVGESPRWSTQEQKLYWIDIQEKHVHRFDPRTAHNESFELPELVTSIALRASGGLILTFIKDIAAFNLVTRRVERIGTVEPHLPNNRFNDGKCDARGRFFAGTMDSVNWSAPVGHLFRFDADHAITAVRSDVVCSNGSGWSPDGRTMYHTESFRYGIYAYDFEASTGAISNRRPFVLFDPNGGAFPDGMTVDADGFVWCNVVGSGEVRRYDPLGKLERVLNLPVPRATDCAFGGPDLKTLYITTARETMTAAQLQSAPLSGSLFAYDCDVAGLPEPLFSG